MQKIVLFLLIACLPFVTFGQKKRSQIRRVSDNYLKVSLSSSLSTVCESNNICDFGNSTTRLYASATNPQRDELVFEWIVTAGIVSQGGSNITWDLKNTGHGPQTAKVRVMDKHGREGSAEIKISVVECGACDPPPPPCPEIMISVIEGRNDITHLAFTVKTEGANDYRPSLFDWTTSLGKIISGQNTNQVEIDASGFEEHELTVTVSVGGFDPSCVTTVSKQVVVKKN